MSDAMRKIREAGETRRQRRRAARPLRANGVSLLILGALLLCIELESMGARGEVAGPVPPLTKPRVAEGSERTRIDEQLRREGEREIWGEERASNLEAAVRRINRPLPLPG